MKDKLVLIGAGGYCRGVLDSLLLLDSYEIVGITDPATPIGTDVYGISVLGTDDILPKLFESGVKKAHITVGSVGNCSLRKKLVEMAENIGFELVTIIDPNAVLAKDVRLGKMVYIGKSATINSDVEIGNYCIINTGSIIEHGCRIGNFVHVAPGSVLVGDIHVGNESHFGLNCSILQGLTIGNRVIVGAGSTVLRNVNDGETVVGIVK